MLYVILFRNFTEYVCCEHKSVGIFQPEAERQPDLVKEWEAGAHTVSWPGKTRCSEVPLLTVSVIPDIRL